MRLVLTRLEAIEQSCLRACTRPVSSKHSISPIPPSLGIAQRAEYRRAVCDVEAEIGAVESKHKAGS